MIPLRMQLVSKDTTLARLRNNGHMCVVDPTFTFAHIALLVRKRLRLQPHEALFFFVGNSLMTGGTAVCEAHARHAVDGTLVVRYARENCFGAAYDSHTSRKPMPRIHLPLTLGWLS